MINYIFLSVITYYSYLLVEYTTHRVSHYKHKYNLLYHNHMNHHRVHYTFKEAVDILPFRYDTYLNMPISFILHTPLLLIIYYLLYRYLYTYSLFIITEINILLFVSDYIHTNIHVKNSWLEKYSLFIKCRNIHLLHHKNFTKNFSLSGYDNTFDYIFKTNYN